MFPLYSTGTITLKICEHQFMGKRISNSSCSECGITIKSFPNILEFEGHEICVFDPVLCANCLEDTCKRYSTVCVNCGETIPPYSQVGVLKGNDEKKQLIHMTTSCLTPGNAFYGYWGKGTLHNFLEIEAC